MQMNVYFTNGNFLISYKAQFCDSIWPTVQSHNMALVSFKLLARIYETLAAAERTVIIFRRLTLSMRALGNEKNTQKNTTSVGGIASEARLVRDISQPIVYLFV